MFPERRELVKMWRSGRARALVTLVEVQGSSYRKRGARMMIDDSGHSVGSISGGCLEAELLRKADWHLRVGATTVRYSTDFDDTDEVPFGLGCGGTLTLLLETADTPEFGILLQALERSLLGEESTLCTTLPTSERRFSRSLLGSQNLTISSDEPQPFVECILPPPRLVVIGAGNDTRPLVRLASLLGWRTVVVDGRTHLAQASRFPEAERVVALGPENGDDLHADQRDLVMLMSHSYLQDRDWLCYFLPLRPRYLGLLGAKQRSSTLLKEAAHSLGWTYEATFRQVSTPAGFDLGGDGAEAIALAVLSEMQASVNGKSVRSRSMDAGVPQQDRHRFALLGSTCAM